MTTQLERLARPFPKSLIHDNPSGGGSYVKHSVVTEKLLAVVGPFSFELVEVIRGHVEGIEPNPQGKSARAKKGAPALDNAVVGAVCRLIVTIDGREVAIEEVGDCESPHNWPHDGARLKDALSDSLKRAAMRTGVTLHLWSGSEFSLYDQLCAAQSAGAGEGSRSRAGTAEPPASAPHAGAGGNDEPRTEPEKSRVPEQAAPATSGSRGSTQSSQREPDPAGVSVRPPTPETPAAPSDPGKWIPPASEMFDALALRKSLHSRGISFYDVKKREGLPNLEDVDNEADFRLYQRVLADLDTANPVKVRA